MNQHRRILNIIAAIRESHPSMVDIYTLGSCFDLFKILRLIFTDAKLYYDNNHIVVRIEKKLYDINGVVPEKGYLPMKQLFSRKSLSRAITQMKKEMAEVKCKVPSISKATCLPNAKKIVLYFNKEEEANQAYDILLSDQSITLLDLKEIGVIGFDTIKT